MITGAALAAVVAFCRRSIVRPVLAVERAAQALAAGSLDVSILDGKALARGDEIGSLGRSMATTISRLAEVVGEARASSDQAASGAGALSDAAEELAGTAARLCAAISFFKLKESVEAPDDGPVALITAGGRPRPSLPSGLG